MRLTAAVLAAGLASCAGSSQDPGSADVAFVPSASEVEAYDFLEVEVRVKAPAVKNPFAEAEVRGPYRVERFDPRTGERRALEPAAGPEWTAPETPAGEDWAFLLRRSGS